MSSPPSPPRLVQDWHALSPEAAAAALGADLEVGLSQVEAADRSQRLGPNALTAQVGRSAWRRFALQFHQPLIYILLASGAVTAFLGEWIDSGVILGVVLVNALVGFIQEGRAEEALAALARSVASQVTVTREGRRQHLDAVDLVPGDLVWLAAGDKVPADLRLIASHCLAVSEAALTGESLPVVKALASCGADTRLADRDNMAYAGTMVVAGQGAGLVVATGDGTETGRIAGLLRETEVLSTPLTRAMGRFSQLLLWVILALAALSFGVGVARGEPPVEMLMAAVALAVGAIPEGLPAAITVTLAIGVARMARRRAIIRRLPAVETLGSTTVICSDKTGTLTENQMTVRELLAGGRHVHVTGEGYAPEGVLARDGAAVEVDGPLAPLLLAGVLCNDATLAQRGGQWEITGDPTEAALLVVARKAGWDEEDCRRQWPRDAELPFDSTHQFMATVHRGGTGQVVFLKGAVERILSRCNRQTGDAGEPLPLDEEAILAQADAMADRGLRVLAFARGCDVAGPLAAAVEGGLEFIGLQGMLDPPRGGAIGAVRACHRAGVRVKMITGDHAATARAIAHQLGLVRAGADVLTGRDLAALDEPGLRAAVGATDVFARVEPEQKLRLVAALQARGEVVAMTGDGVNDAPALKAADIGIAMGAGGTEVAKEAAAMVLTDDNFATIEAAVEEGRGVYDNLVKFIAWTLPTNFGEGLVILAAILAGVTLPITPLQILWINMTTAVLLGLTLAFEPIEPDVMRRPPRPPGSPVLDRVLVGRIVLVGVVLLAGAFGLFLRWRELGASLEEARTVAVNVFVFCEMVYLFNCRSLEGPFWSSGLFSNPWLWGGLICMAGLQAAFTYWPPMQAVFASASLHGGHWVEIGLAGGSVGVLVGLEKRLRRRSAPVEARAA
ncbi:MAG: HAD-IC family P-type ATPase [Zoogloeaceae bacterium]|nr:HAD-IC family P-type ATPase [Zoogloeaceae bacterium]